MKVKSWAKYFIYIFLIILIVFLAQHTLGVYKKTAQSTFNFTPYNILMIIFYVLIGLLLGLEHLFSEIRNKGNWVVNLPKVVLMGIPSLYFSLAIFIYYNNIPLLSFSVKYLMEGGSFFINIFQIIFGYSIITSFYKNNNTDISITKF